MKSLPALALAAEQHVRTNGPLTTADLLTLLATVTTDPDRAEAGIRLAITCGRLELDHDGTLRTTSATENAA